MAELVVGDGIWILIAVLSLAAVILWIMLKVGRP